MKKIDWNEEKNSLLKNLRGIGFEEAVRAINNRNILAVIDNPSSSHSNQQIYILEINNYAYIVPFVEDDEKVFLKTIYPSRKYTKKYLERKI